MEAAAAALCLVIPRLLLWSLMHEQHWEATRKLPWRDTRRLALQLHMDQVQLPWTYISSPMSMSQQLKWDSSSRCQNVQVSTNVTFTFEYVSASLQGRILGKPWRAFWESSAAATSTARKEKKISSNKLGLTWRTKLETLVYLYEWMNLSMPSSSHELLP